MEVPAVIAKPFRFIRPVVPRGTWSPDDDGWGVVSTTGHLLGVVLRRPVGGGRFMYRAATSPSVEYTTRDGAAYRLLDDLKGAGDGRPNDQDRTADDGGAGRGRDDRTRGDVEGDRATVRPTVTIGAGDDARTVEVESSSIEGTWNTPPDAEPVSFDLPALPVMRAEGSITAEECAAIIARMVEPVQKFMLVVGGPIAEQLREFGRIIADLFAAGIQYPSPSEMMRLRALSATPEQVERQYAKQRANYRRRIRNRRR